MSALSGSREPRQSALSRPVGFDPERIADLELALGLALNTLVHFEPGDSRAVSNEFVAMAAILCDIKDNREECRDIIRAATSEGGQCDYALAEATARLEEDVDSAVTRAKTWGGLSNKEVAKELRRIADLWESEEA